MELPKEGTLVRIRALAFSSDWSGQLCVVVRVDTEAKPERIWVKRLSDGVEGFKVVTRLHEILEGQDNAFDDT